MRKLMIGLVLAGTALTAIPATAQSGEGYRGGYDQRDDRDRGGYGDRDDRYSGNALRRASMMVDRVIQRGTLSRRESYYFRNELRQLQRLDAQFRQGGYSRWEREQIDVRADRLIRRLREERRDDRRDDRRGGDDRYDRD